MGLVRAISHVLAAVFTNATNFNRRWNQGDAESATGEMPYRWEGRWISETNGHHGALRCLLTQKSPAEFSATFYALYCRGLRVCYTISLRGQHQDGKLALEGEADIGRLAGGTYRYSGFVTAGEFRCSYECKYDRGTFEMFPAARGK